MKVCFTSTGIQMPPSAFLAMIIEREFFLTYWAWPFQSIRVPNKYVDTFFLNVELDVFHRPGW